MSIDISTFYPDSMIFELDSKLMLKNSLLPAPRPNTKRKQEFINILTKWPTYLRRLILVIIEEGVGLG